MTHEGIDMSIKDNIKEELNKLISKEEDFLTHRELVNSKMNLDNYDTMAERNFLISLKKFVDSI